MSEPNARIQTFFNVSVIFPIDSVESYVEYYNNDSKLSIMVSNQLKLIFNRNISSKSSELFSFSITTLMEEKNAKYQPIILLNQRLIIKSPTCQDNKLHRQQVA